MPWLGPRRTWALLLELTDLCLRLRDHVVRSPQGYTTHAPTKAAFGFPQSVSFSCLLLAILWWWWCALNISHASIKVIALGKLSNWIFTAILWDGYNYSSHFVDEETRLRKVKWLHQRHRAVESKCKPRFIWLWTRMSTSLSCTRARLPSSTANMTSSKELAVCHFPSLCFQGSLVPPSSSPGSRFNELSGDNCQELALRPCQTSSPTV